MQLIDYRDRVSVVIWVTLMGLAAQRFLTFPSRSFEQVILGSPITLTITANTVLAVLLAGLVASGTEAVVRAHPRVSAAAEPGRAPKTPGRASAAHIDLKPRAKAWAHWIYWGVPISLIIVAVLLLPLAPSSGYWMIGLIATGIALGLSLAGIYYTIDPFQVGYRRARLGMNILTYGIALALFLVVYRTRARSIISGTEIALVSGLLALELLRGSERPIVLVAVYAGITGLVLGQVTWALNYWRLAALTGGLVLLLAFYNVVGLAQHAIQGRIRRRELLEYGLITVTALALIWEFAP